MSTLLRRSASTPTAAEIADAVEKPGALLAAEQRLAELRERRDQLAEQMQAIRAALPVGAVTMRADERAVAQERRVVEAQLRDARAAVEAAQKDRVSSVAAALNPLRSLAEGEIWTALDSIIEQWRLLDEIEHQTTLAGGAGLPSDRPNAEQLRVFLRFFILKGVREQASNGASA